MYIYIHTRDICNVKIHISADADPYMRMPARETPHMRIHMRVSVREDPPIHKRIQVTRYPWTLMRMQIFVTFLNNTSYYQMVAAFVNAYRICICLKY